MRHRITLFLALHLSMRWFQMPLKGVSFLKLLATLQLFKQAYPLPQNMTKIVSLLDSPSIFLNINPVHPAELRAPNVQIRVFRTLYL